MATKGKQRIHVFTVLNAAGQVMWTATQECERGLPQICDPWEPMEVVMQENLTDFQVRPVSRSLE